ncbi:MAG: dipeptidase PepE [Bacteroidales bacterium]|nr:dipeptidase PepE [Bacteroidales bacterium]
MKQELLLISNSTNPGEDYLGWPRPYISSFLNELEIKEVLFIPYAGVSLSKESLEKSYDVYEARVAGVFESMGFRLRSVHRESDPLKAIMNAPSIAVGGGNTWHLVKVMQEMGLIQAIRERVLAGVPYLGWSAGSNVACPTLKTTNDMPIIEPISFNVMNLIPFQINPHYLDKNPEGHGGETREDRINEFLVINPEIIVAGLREATLFRVSGQDIQLLGKRPLRVFRAGQEPQEYQAGDDISFLMK